MGLFGEKKPMRDGAMKSAGLDISDIEAAAAHSKGKLMRDGSRLMAEKKGNYVYWQKVDKNGKVGKQGKMFSK